jgi:probable phosphoglycerate mutase
MTTRFMLVRHASCAQTETTLLGHAIDASLSARGLAEADALTRRLARETPTLIFTSPLRRAQQTAAAIARHLQIDAHVCRGLDEIDFGLWAGRTFETLENDARWREWNTHRGTARTPSGESIVQVQARIVGVLDEMSMMHAGHTIVLVTHAEIIRSALLFFLKCAAEDYRHIEIAPASLTRLRTCGTETIIDAVNERPALDECVAA